MKIALPVGEKSIHAPVYDSFGRAPYYLLYNTKSQEIEYLDHRAVVAQGAAGIRAAQALPDNGVRAIITAQCGENSEKQLRKAEVLVYKAISEPARENIDAFRKNQLSLLTEFKSKREL